jgi:hypothetical protein
MNERIRELYEQARLQAKSIDADIDPKGWMDLYHQKFAELIVLECADFVAQNTLEDQGMWGKIVRHFGVEE